MFETGEYGSASDKSARAVYFYRRGTGAYETLRSENDCDLFASSILRYDSLHPVDVPCALITNDLARFLNFALKIRAIRIITLQKLHTFADECGPKRAAYSAHSGARTGERAPFTAKSSLVCANPRKKS